VPSRASGGHVVIGNVVLETVNRAFRPPDVLMATFRPSKCIAVFGAGLDQAARDWLGKSGIIELDAEVGVDEHQFVSRMWWVSGMLAGTAERAAHNKQIIPLSLGFSAACP
jgi:hypothetical protein